MATKRDRWTEDEVLSLPAGELDYFDRKAGDFLKDADREKKLAKALSAFANSGGGHLVIGVRDDGTVDGVPKILKGRTSAKDWLEQVIPHLLSLPLQDFRVHEVEPAVSTTIPSGTVIIVVDVGDSQLAPHQDIYMKVYYHRVSGRSEPAPHHHLELLRARERFPSTDIVCAWRDDVINPLLYRAVREQQYLKQRKWTWDRWAYKGSGNGLKALNIFGDRSRYSGNDEQFFESYENIQAALDTHDKALQNVRDCCEQLFQAIKSSSHLLDVYVKTTATESLQELKAGYPQNLQYCSTDEEILRSLFGSTEREAHLATLAEHIVNKSVLLDLSGNTTAPFWHTHRDKFLEVLEFPPISHYWERAGQARDRLLDHLEALISLLKTTRSDLSKQHGVRVEALVEIPSEFTI